MITKITWQNMNAGNFVGAMTYDVVVGEGGIDIIEALTRIKTHKTGKVVAFRGDFTLANADDMYTMAKSLRDMGYATMSLTDGKHFFPWFTWTNYVIVATSKIWPGFDVSEFRWENPKAEPHMPSNATKTNLFIDGKPEDMLEFIKSHGFDNPWRMLMRTRTVEESIYAGS